MTDTTVAVIEGRYTTCGFLYHAESGQVLLHHRDGNTLVLPGVWSFFCGGSEPEDRGDPAATWRREMAEELGVALRPDQVVFLFESPSPVTRRRRYVFYSGWPRADASFALGEGDGFGWFTLAAALALPDLPSVAKADLRRFGRRLGLPGAD